MAHGDDAGLRLPPRLAPVQVVVLAVRTEDGAGEAASALATALRAAGHRVELDVRTELSFGRRVVGWELKGVPVRIELGPRDLAAGTVVLCRRDDGTKVPVRLDDAVAEVARVLTASQEALLNEARQLRESRTVTAGTLEEANEAAGAGFAVVPGGLLSGPSGGPGDGDGEARLNAAGVSVRALQRPDGSLPDAREGTADLVAVVARAY